jgi:hypothetical protein
MKQWIGLMPSARAISPQLQSGALEEHPTGPLFGGLDADAEIMLFSDAGRGELPGEHERRARLGFDDEAEAPYWATWGF